MAIYVFVLADGVPSWRQKCAVVKGIAPALLRNQCWANRYIVGTWRLKLVYACRSSISEHYL